MQERIISPVFINLAQLKRIAKKVISETEKESVGYVILAIVHKRWSCMPLEQSNLGAFSFAEVLNFKMPMLTS